MGIEPAAPQGSFDPIRKLSDLQIPIHLWHPLGLDLYAITEEELNLFNSKTGEVGLDFTVAVACLSISVTALGTLYTGAFSTAVQVGWGIVCGSTFLTGIVSLVRWRKASSKLSSVLKTIKERKAKLGEG